VLTHIVSVPFRAAAALFGHYPDVLVLEYSASPDGDIRRLAKLAHPTVAVVTAIGPAHLEVFGSVARIAEHKGALVRAVPREGLVVLGPDNPHADQMGRDSAAPVIRVRGIGRALSDNIAREVGRFFGVLDETIASAIQDVPAVRHRLEFRSAGTIRIIDDAVNANPLSMTLGLETLRQHAGPGQRTVALLGFMAELGSEAAQYHQQIGALARARADVTIGVGPLARYYDAERWFESVEECIAALPGILRPGDLVFVKGSSASGMKGVAAAIEKMSFESRHI
jgi:UDP-N-acetylmuramoyl-tripeptide--D-alanyl-D-alanine ligase